MARSWQHISDGEDLRRGGGGGCGGAAAAAAGRRARVPACKAPAGGEKQRRAGWLLCCLTRLRWSNGARRAAATHSLLTPISSPPCAPRHTSTRIFISLRLFEQQLSAPNIPGGTWRWPGSAAQRGGRESGGNYRVINEWRGAASLTGAGEGNRSGAHSGLITGRRDPGVTVARGRRPPSPGEAGRGGGAGQVSHGGITHR